jgi:hypothetical protein
MAPQNKSRKFDYFSSSHANKKNILYTLKWSRFTLKEHESPVNEGHTESSILSLFNMRSDGVGGPSNVFWYNTKMSFSFWRHRANGPTHHTSFAASLHAADTQLSGLYTTPLLIWCSISLPTVLCL